MTLPATKCGVEGVESSTMAQAHATSAKNETIVSKSSSCPWVNPAGLLLNEASALFSGMSENRDDTVAAVATQPAISPSPATTWPVTKNSATDRSWIMTTPKIKVVSATAYPSMGKKRREVGLYVRMICRMIVEAVENRAMQIDPRKKTTGPAVRRDTSSPHV